MIYQQAAGLGIGLRASACLAKLIMGLLDRRWAFIQDSWGLLVQIWIRYNDDIRCYLSPINPGWEWTDTGWTFTGVVDETDPMEHTCRQIGKSLNMLIDFLSFTTEKENDFKSGFLPTLDTQTKVLDDWSIAFHFFSKRGKEKPFMD